MPPPTVYIETSVVSYLVARPSRDIVMLGHQTSTKEWWRSRLVSFEPLVSPLVVMEAGRGDHEFARKRLEAIRDFTVLESTPEVDRLAGMYVAEGAIPPGERADAFHLALASIHRIDYLLTWNCKHIASQGVRRKAATINAREGLPMPILCTPEELM